MAKTIKQGRKKGQGRKAIPISEKKSCISIGVYYKNSEIDKLNENSDKFNNLKSQVIKTFKKGIENILK